MYLLLCRQIQICNNTFCTSDSWGVLGILLCRSWTRPERCSNHALLYAPLGRWILRYEPSTGTCLCLEIEHRELRSVWTYYISPKNVRNVRASIVQIGNRTNCCRVIFFFHELGHWLSPTWHKLIRAPVWSTILRFPRKPIECDDALWPTRGPRLWFHENRSRKGLRLPASIHIIWDG